eukprot:COSAG06_NODE_206_length_20263_cov_29.102559_6_plen_74_part_00
MLQDGVKADPGLSHPCELADGVFGVGLLLCLAVTLDGDRAYCGTDTSGAARGIGRVQKRVLWSDLNGRPVLSF